ncbi:NAD(P)-dependent alcohol dehydrogenase [Epilithonimonas hungarica]|uniref:Uncharacterized zinc-type alcohol dehydrogenase-like protein n=1 Tax=Epilithonimonas hungarica TaxID=454006 RepID=A0A1G7S9P2_9FLAO|nr:uncharacterized zinc-type alcohol dehydrogenase-like protein [Epilithonimonas hungarica]
MIKSRGYAAQDVNKKLAPWDFERRSLGEKDVQIQIWYCGVCHSDLHQVRNDWAPGVFPMVPGHEIVGKVVGVGDEVSRFKAGDLAGVGTIVDACGHCEDCENGHEQTCHEGAVQTYNSKGRDGLVTYGGYSDTIVVKEEFVLHISEKLNLAGAAPLLCAGVTTWSPLRKWHVGKGHKLAVVGLGGLGHMAVKFGVALGAEVTVLSTSPNKEVAAKELGAHHFIVSKDKEQMQSVFRSFDFILDTVANDHDINPYIPALRTNGVYINVGLPVTPWQISSFALAWGDKAITGSGVGGLKETQDMLDFCAENNITADIELIAIQDINKAFERMEKGDVRYRFVIDIATL